MPSLEHVGIAVEVPDAVVDLYEMLLEIVPYKTETLDEQGVRTHFIAAGTAKLELLEALGDDTAVARFLAQRSEGLHHLAFEVEDVEATMARCRTLGFTPLSDAPRPGADGKRIFFLHPKQTHGVLVEFCQSVPVTLAPERVPYRDGTLAVYEAGSSHAPPVLLLHGAAGCTQLETAGLLRRLEPDHHVIAVDFSGHGASDHVGAFSADLFTDNVRTALDRFGIDRADVFGFSMGGAMALHFAREHPGRVRRLAVHGTHVAWDEARVAAMHRRLDAEAIAARGPERAAELATAHADWKTLLRRTRAFIATLPDRSADMTAGAAAVDHPTLVSAVDRDDLVPLKASLELHDVLPRARLALIPGDRHALQDTRLDLLFPLLHDHFSI